MLFCSKSTYDYNSVVMYSCKAGYDRSGPHKRKCISRHGRGTWDEYQPRCVGQFCVYFPIPLHLSTLYGNASNKIIKKIILYSEKDCGDPGSPMNGVLHGSNFKLARQVTFTCNTGYRLVGSSSRTCRTDGKWSGHNAECKRKLCDKISDNFLSTYFFLKYDICFQQSSPVRHQICQLT